MEQRSLRRVDCTGLTQVPRSSPSPLPFSPSRARQCPVLPESMFPNPTLHPCPPLTLQGSSVPRAMLVRVQAVASRSDVPQPNPPSLPPTHPPGVVCAWCYMLSRVRADA